jgi:hypothetical protein
MLEILPTLRDGFEANNSEQILGRFDDFRPGPKTLFRGFQDLHMMMLEQISRCVIHLRNS